MKLLDMALALAPDCQIESIGIRPGEKLHEVLLSEDEARDAVEAEDMFVIQPAHSWWRKENWTTARRLAEGFRYSSDNNSQWLTPEQLERLISPVSSPDSCSVPLEPDGAAGQRSMPRPS
jgi:UDP-N-acetylglucosamine 4,6-dehydratase